MRPKYNVFINGPHDGCEYCECSQFQALLRRAKRQANTARDIELKQYDLPFCRHILAAKLALVFHAIKEEDVVKVTEEEWARRSIEHISNNIPMSFSPRKKDKD